jgi:FkbM family methyltransferase
MTSKSSLIRVEAAFGPMFAFPDDLVTQQITEFGAHTRPELAFLLSVVREGDRVFDLGAHIGTFTVPLAKKVGSTGRVVAVEATPEIFAAAVRNVALHDLADRVVLRNAVVGPPGAYEAVVELGNTSATFFRSRPLAAAHDTITIDALAGETFVPDVIKIDVEGLEAQALLPSNVLRARKPIIYAEIAETHLARAGASVEDLNGFFRQLGYRLFRNVGARNAANDTFEVAELRTLHDGGTFFDVLAVYEDDPRVAMLTADGSSDT